MSAGRQLDLFGSPPAPAAAVRSRTAAVGPAPVDPALRDLADSLPATLRLGTSSWSFPGWQGIVWDRRASAEGLARSGLAAYARHPLLRAVGIDRTYYAPLPAEALAAYAADVPEGFRFMVKASGECTTPWLRDPDGRPAGINERYLDAGWAAGEVVGPFVEGLGPTAGALVFQFPPQGPSVLRQPARFAERLGGFLAALPRGPLYAVELRDAALLGPDYFLALEDAGARHCFNVHPRMPPPDEQLALAEGTARGPLVVRWMLGSGLRYEQARQRYAPFDRLVDEDPATRRTLAGMVVAHLRAGHDVFAIANNKAEGSAPLSVFGLARAVAAGL